MALACCVRPTRRGSRRCTRTRCCSCFGAGRTGEAFDVADAARGRALLEHLVSARTDIDTSSDLGHLLEREQLLRRIDALTARLRTREATPPKERMPTFVALTRGLSDSLARFRGEYEALLARS